MDDPKKTPGWKGSPLNVWANDESGISTAELLLNPCDLEDVSIAEERPERSSKSGFNPYDKDR